MRRISGEPEHVDQWRDALGITHAEWRAECNRLAFLLCRVIDCGRQHGLDPEFLDSLEEAWGAKRWNRAKTTGRR